MSYKVNNRGQLTELTTVQHQELLVLSSRANDKCSIEEFILHVERLIQLVREECSKDAARYQYLRNDQHFSLLDNGYALYRKELDKHIDKAIAKRPPQTTSGQTL